VSSEVSEAAETSVPENHSGDNVRASWPFSLHHIRSNIAHCNPEAKEALVSAFLWCSDAKHPVDRATFARRIGYSPNTVYKLYSGKYRDQDGNQLDVPDKAVSAIRQFLVLERERFLGQKNVFVMTPTAKRVFTACDLARESQTPVFITGRSHIGKTAALEAYAAANNHGRTVYVRMKAASGLGGMIRRIAERLGVSPNSNTANLVDYIKNSLTQDMLLCLDELHLLMYTYRRQSFFACLEVIREIYDEVRCGLVLCGTTLLMDKIAEGARGEMEQLLRRGVHRITLPNMPTKGDVTAILQHWQLEMPKRGASVTVQGITEDPLGILRKLAKHDGLLAITERLRYARKLSERAGEDLSWKHVVEAHLTIEHEAQETEEW
jgi:DNA transposition AAA+ family ATPase